VRSRGVVAGDEHPVADSERWLVRVGGKPDGFKDAEGCPPAVDGAAVDAADASGCGGAGFSGNGGRGF
jgi:hypothetical protein